MSSKEEEEYARLSVEKLSILCRQRRLLYKTPTKKELLARLAKYENFTDKRRTLNKYDFKAVHIAKQAIRHAIDNGSRHLSIRILSQWTYFRGDWATTPHELEDALFSKLLVRIADDYELNVMVMDQQDNPSYYILN